MVVEKRKAPNTLEIADPSFIWRHPRSRLLPDRGRAWRARPTEDPVSQMAVRSHWKVSVPRDAPV